MKLTAEEYNKLKSLSCINSKGRILTTEKTIAGLSEKPPVERKTKSDSIVPKSNILIGIDPDLRKSGVSIYNKEKKKLTMCTCMFIWDLFDFLDKQVLSMTYLEYPSNTNTWHKGGKGAALNVGKNQAIAIIIWDFLKHKNINHILIAPAGYSGIFEDEEHFKQTTGWNERTNKDARASAAMIWGR